MLGIIRFSVGWHSVVSNPDGCWIESNASVSRSCRQRCAGKGWAHIHAPLNSTFCINVEKESEWFERWPPSAVNSFICKAMQLCKNPSLPQCSWLNPEACCRTRTRSVFPDWSNTRTGCKSHLFAKKMHYTLLLTCKPATNLLKQESFAGSCHQRSCCSLNLCIFT